MLLVPRAARAPHASPRAELDPLADRRNPAADLDPDLRLGPGLAHSRHDRRRDPGLDRRKWLAFKVQKEKAPPYPRTAGMRSLLSMSRKYI